MVVLDPTVTEDTRILDTIFLAVVLEVVLLLVTGKIGEFDVVMGTMICVIVELDDDGGSVGITTGDVEGGCEEVTGGGNVDDWGGSTIEVVGRTTITIVLVLIFFDKVKFTVFEATCASKAL